MCLASTVDAIPGKKSFRVSVIHVNVHVKLCERLPSDCQQSGNCHTTLEMSPDFGFMPHQNGRLVLVKSPVRSSCASISNPAPHAALGYAAPRQPAEIPRVEFAMPQFT